MRMRTLLAALVALLLLSSACSGDSDDFDALETQSQDDDGQGDADDLGDIPDDLGDIPDDLGDIPDDLGDIADDLGGILDSDCIEFSLAFVGLTLGGFAAAAGGEDALEDVEADLDELYDMVPSGLEEDFAIVGEAYNDFFAEIADVGILGAGDLDDPLSDPDVEAAQDNIDQWLAENCEDFSG